MLVCHIPLQKVKSHFYEFIEALGYGESIILSQEMFSYEVNGQHGGAHVIVICTRWVMEES